MSYIKIGKYYGLDVNAPIYQFKEVLDQDYLDISNVDTWFGAEEFANKDYLFCRNGVINFILNNGGFSSLRESDKLIVAENFCVSKTERNQVLNDDEQERYWSIFVSKSKESRIRRWEAAKYYVSYRLSSLDSSDLAEDTLILNEKYIEYGIESLQVDGKDGIYDWIKGEGNFTNNGFPSKTYYTVELRDHLINILDGNY